MKNLYRKFMIETSRIEKCYVSYVSGVFCGDCSYPDTLVDGLVIRAYDSWVRFCRELIFRSAAERPLTLSGDKLAKAIGIDKRTDVVPKYLLTLPVRLRRKPVWWEPRWGDATQCLNVANSIGIANYPQISAGLGFAGSPAEDLCTIRNYIAHRKADTANRIVPIFSRYRISINLGIYPILSSLTLGGIFRFSEWLRRMQVMAEISLQ